MKIINYKSLSYLIPLERELEASVVPFALLCFFFLLSSCISFSNQLPPFLLFFFFFLSPHILFSSFIFHYKLHFYLLMLSLNYYFIICRPLHVKNRIQSWSPEVFGLSRGSGSALLLRPSPQTSC